jgi:hypothetical protein
MRNLGNSFNPMARLSNISPFRGFGRAASTPPAPSAKDAAGKGFSDGGDLSTVGVPFLETFGFSMLKIFRHSLISQRYCLQRRRRGSTHQ